MFRVFRVRVEHSQTRCFRVLQGMSNGTVLRVATILVDHLDRFVDLVEKDALDLFSKGRHETVNGEVKRRVDDEQEVSPLCHVQLAYHIAHVHVNRIQDV